jgi:hypothetical protein
MKKYEIIEYNRELFYFFSLAIIVFFLLEIFFPGIVLAYFNVNILLFLWLINFIFFVFNKKN